jgi:hypothetical protein
MIRNRLHTRSVFRGHAQGLPLPFIPHHPGELDGSLFSMLDPHLRMNVTLTRREAEDIAAYIGSLVK